MYVSLCMCLSLSSHRLAACRFLMQLYGIFKLQFNIIIIAFGWPGSVNGSMSPNRSTLELAMQLVYGYRALSAAQMGTYQQNENNNKKNGINMQIKIKPL